MAVPIKHAKRIAVIGNAGSGKSTLAQKLHAIFNLPVIHLDQYFWKPGWVRPDSGEYKKVHDQLCDKEKWIIDGINLKHLEYRIQRADIIIFLNMPRWVCFWNIFKRAFHYYGKETPSSAPGCVERFDREFLKWVWDFKGKHHPKVTELLNKYRNEKQVYILNAPRQIDAFVAQLPITH